MRPDVYRQLEFAASPVRRDTFGPVATPLWKVVEKMTVWGGETDSEARQFVTVKFRLREAINSEPYVCRRRLATFIIPHQLPPVM